MAYDNAVAKTAEGFLNHPAPHVEDASLIQHNIFGSVIAAVEAEASAVKTKVEAVSKTVEAEVAKEIKVVEAEVAKVVPGA